VICALVVGFANQANGSKGMLHSGFLSKPYCSITTAASGH
ncbi:MAG: hypothetical protein ACI832_001081, partial [Rheinheimera aquimaris]